MLTVTLAARERLAHKLVYKKATSEQALRFVRRLHGWQLRLDGADPADTTVSHEGRTVLLLDPETARMMKSKTLDVERTAGGPRLTLGKSNPAKGS